jgi:hypothetical protein
MNKDGHGEFPAIDVDHDGGDDVDVGVPSSCSSLPDHFERDKEKSLLTDTPEPMDQLLQ